ncbi:hypothetical protein BU52_03715 [Streptomyces toyocaensis]|uniref:DUF7715 domain-containing protein n=1 Tax=Streptomyces toyocaensis TaxID=55952 RepID=A0A081Y046_STRTO|nr:hypothetical protein [Streptomyces toyocaensis]KES09169.1 hypothetical protein BU52_03715 [Streptomyces toyocaensis]
MKLIIPAFDQHYRASATDHNWTDPEEILTIGADEAFAGIDSRRYTTHGRVTALDVARDEVTDKIGSTRTRSPGHQEPVPTTTAAEQSATATSQHSAASSTASLSAWDVSSAGRHTGALGSSVDCGATGANAVLLRTPPSAREGYGSTKRRTPNGRAE